MPSHRRSNAGRKCARAPSSQPMRSRGRFIVPRWNGACAERTAELPPAATRRLEGYRQPVARRARARERHARGKARRPARRKHRRARIIGKTEQRAYHLLHLLLRSAAISGNTGFHFARRIAVRRNLRLRRSEQDHAAHFRQLQRRLHIERGKNGFDRHSVRSEFLDQPRNQ